VHAQPIDICQWGSILSLGTGHYRVGEACLPCLTSGGHDLIVGRLAQPMADDVPLPMDGVIWWSSIPPPGRSALRTSARLAR